MILFEKVRWKNLLSTGNSFTEVDLRKSPSTLIVGSNGSGKSTLLDALSFGLFNVPHRNINKPQLVNSINDKGLEVEVDFSIGPDRYKVRRGIKPRIFEIIKNGSLINQEADSRDYQAHLEQVILGMTHKSFHQIVVLGSSSFIPFMQLQARHRREVIEDLLDITIFTRMNLLLKAKTSLIKEEYRGVESAVELIGSKIALQKDYIAGLQQLNQDMADKKREQIKEAKRIRKEHEAAAKVIEDNLVLANEELASRSRSILNREAQLKELTSMIKAEIKLQEGILEKFSSSDRCWTCEQDLTEETKALHIDRHKTELQKLEGKLAALNPKLIEIQNKRAEHSELEEMVRKGQDEAKKHRTEAASRRREIETLQTELDNLSSNSFDVGKAQADLEVMEREHESILARKHELANEMTYSTTMFEMLKDGGLKAKIIQQYLPVMNRLINHYLQVLDFFVSFSLDETFQEVIKSRHQDVFSYASFSEGEKQRLDLAILFMFRQIAKMKNSAVTNLLILDETFDSSLDSEGVDSLFKILDTLATDNNVFVISHKRDILDSKFPDKLVFEKVGNYSVMREE